MFEKRDMKLRKELFGKGNESCLNLEKGKGVIGELLNNASYIVSCEKCKHLIYKKDAIDESYIHSQPIHLGWGVMGEKDAIGKRYFCPKCKPKTKKKK